MKGNDMPSHDEIAKRISDEVDHPTDLRVPLAQLTGEDPIEAAARTVKEQIDAERSARTARLVANLVSAFFFLLGVIGAGIAGMIADSLVVGLLAGCAVGLGWIAGVTQDDED